MTTPDSFDSLDPLVRRSDAAKSAETDRPLRRRAREGAIAIAVTMALSGFSFAEAGPDRVESRFRGQVPAASGLEVVTSGERPSFWQQVSRIAAEGPTSGAPETTVVPISPVSVVPEPVLASPSSAVPARARRRVRPVRPEANEAAADPATVPVSETEVPVAPEPVEPVEPVGPGDYLGAFSVTCYALNGNTASGEPVHEGGVAVDRRVIAFGTRLYIENVGWRVANDTGGSVRGNRLDIWLPSRDDCISFGRRTLDVYRS